MNPWLIFVVSVLLLDYLLDVLVALGTLDRLDRKLPSEICDLWNPERLQKSREYIRTTTRFTLLQNSVATALLLGFILTGGFNLVDLAARSLELGPIPTGLVFTGLLLLFSGLLNLPFTIYATFVIEERFGLNRITVRTFVLDLLKTIFLALMLGGPLLAGVLWFFESTGSFAWLYCWLLLIIFVLVVQWLAPVVIMPLFNRFTPLPEGGLKEVIEIYARQQNFSLQGVYTMDGSRRSSRLNAFFTGFGRFRRIVFYDTLLDKLQPGEILAVLAHEMGHYKLRHIPKMMLASMVQTGIMFAILSIFIGNQGLFAAFGMEYVSVYASLVFFGFLYAPISTLFSVLFNRVAREYEFEADAFAVRTTGLAVELISGLKKLAQANLTNPDPHPLDVWLHYSHPPLSERIRALVRIQDTGDPEVSILDFGRCCLCDRRITLSDRLENSRRPDLCRWCLAGEESCGCADD
ncbi:M48 family metallopeptidase [Desulfolithobacter sp.]